MLVEYQQEEKETFSQIEPNVGEKYVSAVCPTNQQNDKEQEI